MILVDRSNAMPPPAAAAASPEGIGHCSVLLDFRAYSAATKNASTAISKTSTGHTIEVTFCMVPPPALSHFSVHCPDLQLPPNNLDLAPHAIATAQDLVLLRVPVDPLGSEFYDHNDYFVYSAHHQNPKLDLLPNPWPYCLGDNELAILGCGADGNNQYVVAALTINPPFTLHMYRSKLGGETGCWTVQQVSVEKDLRDSVCPIPDTADSRLMYHLTTNVIILGGAQGTVGWVDLWRGILLCDVLEEKSRPKKLRDMPLPLPAMGNRRRYLRDSERFVRDLTVSQHKDSIKYVEMEIYPPRVVNAISTGQWKATTWSMPIPVTSWEDWRTECTAESQEFHVSDPRHCELLQELMSSSSGEEVKEATLSLGSMHVGYPVFSIDDDVVYLSCKAAPRGMMGLVVAVDVRKKELQGVAKLDIKRNTRLMHRYIATEISKYLKATDQNLQAISSELGPAVGANKEMPTSSDNTSSTSTDPASKEQVAQDIHVDGLNQATTQNRETGKEKLTSLDNKPSTNTDPVPDESQVAKNSNATYDLNRVAYQNKRMPLKDFLSMEAEEEKAKEKEKEAKEKEAKEREEKATKEREENAAKEKEAKEREEEAREEKAREEKATKEREEKAAKEREKAAKEKEDKRSFLRRWYLKTTCRS